MPEPKPADNNILWHQSGINQASIRMVNRSFSSYAG
jgi:hypothetical protein